MWGHLRGGSAMLVVCLFLWSQNAAVSGGQANAFCSCQSSRVTDAAAVLLLVQVQRDTRDASHKFEGKREKKGYTTFEGTEK